MITCPECTQINPPDNRFCQHCGFSLVASCPHCDAEVKLEDARCGACGEWLAAPLLGLVVEGDAEPLLTAEYADFQKRYLLVAPAAQREQTFPRLSVIDTQPEEPSYLEQVLVHEAESLQKLELTDKESLSNPQLWIQMGIPAIARHYLSLQDISPAFPFIQDAWISPDQHIILLEDRQGLTNLSQYLTDQRPIYEQVLQWCFQMAKMWRELEPLTCCQTLLNLDNLYLDEDESIVIQQLIPDHADTLPEIKELTALWQIIFNFANGSEFQALNALADQCKAGELKTILELQKALKDLVPDEDLGGTTVLQGGDATEMPEEPWEQRSEFASDEPEKSVDAVTEPNLDRLEYASEADELPTVVLPMHLLNLEDAGLTDIGTQRDHNEDYFGIQTRIEKQENLLGRQVQGRGFYIVCDGMGGHAAGEVASALSVETMQNFFKKHWDDGLPDEDTIKQAIWTTNQKVYDINLRNSRSGSGRMGTTLVMVLVQNNRAAIAHVGDSRIYRISRKWNLEQLTVDHEVGQREIQKGVEPEIAYGRADAYQLTQAIGPRDNTFVNPDVHFIDINEDCLFLLCSDGLSDNNLLEESWEKYLLPLLSSRANLEQGVKELVELANERNGHDNITAVLVRVRVRPNLGIQSSGA